MSNPGLNKRRKERDRAERKQTKMAEREQRRAAKPTRVVVEGEDPDLAGMVAGPQPVQTDDEDSDD